MDKIELQKIVGNNLQRCRAKAHLTQEQVAERAGITPSFYTNLERGKRAMSLVVLRALADALGVSADCLLYEDCSDRYIENIRVLLSDKPESFVMAAEGVLQSLVENFLNYPNDKA